MDEDDIERACAGDEAALSRVLRALEPTLRAGISIQAPYRRDLEPDDLLQVTYVEAFLRIASLRERSEAGVRAWLRRMLDTNLKDGIRGLERAKRPDPRRRVTRDGAGGSARTLLGRLVGPTGSPSGVVSLREEAARLRSALGRLPADYRRVIEEVDLAERSVPEVAAELGRSPGAVHMIRRRGHDRLRELLTAAE